MVIAQQENRIRDVLTVLIQTWQVRVARVQMIISPELGGLCIPGYRVYPPDKWNVSRSMGWFDG